MEDEERGMVCGLEVPTRRCVECGGRFIEQEDDVNACPECREEAGR